LLKEAGFNLHSSYGDFHLTPYGLDSERMMMLCLKSPEAA
jgi:hypothetical protein